MGNESNKWQCKLRIDDDRSRAQLVLFDEYKKKTKIEAFQDELKMKIINQEITDNKEVYLHTINKGHIPKHAREIIKQLKKENIINYDSKEPLISYNSVFKNNKVVKFRVIKNEND